MKKKGFTLVELLAVIVVLGIILVIAVPKIGNIIDNEKEALYQDTVSKIEKSISIYLNDHLNLTNNDNFTVSLNTLCDENYLNCPILDPRTKQNMTGEIMVIGSANGYTYKFMDTTNMLLWYDAEYNNGLNSHSTTTTTWKDLSGNNKNGTINGATWGTNYLNFDGVNDWVSIGLLNQNTYTIEVIASQTAIVNSEVILMGNFESGGYGITFEKGYINTLTCINTYVYNASPIISSTNHIDAYSGTYDNNYIKLFQNGILKNQIAKIGNIKVPSFNTIMVLGANPSRVNVSGNYFNGKIYSVRIYNKALTDGEIKHNYEIDKIRYELD